jgi:hypothetical protein
VVPLVRQRCAPVYPRDDRLPFISAGDWVQLGIADQASNRLFGNIGLYVANDKLSAEIGFTLEPTAQGRGIATAGIPMCAIWPVLVFLSAPAMSIRKLVVQRFGANLA